MTITMWVRQPERRAQLLALLLLGIAIVWGLFRTVHVLHLHWTMGADQGHDLSAHDLFTYYSVWSVLGNRDCADIALRESVYAAPQK